MVVPCFARKKLNEMVGKLFLALDLEQEEFVFHLKKGMYTTHIYGPHYEHFARKCGCEAGDRVMVELDHPPPFLFIKAETYEASPVQTDNESAYDTEDDSGDESENKTEDDREAASEDHDLGFEGITPVFTKGLKLTAVQKDIMNHCIGCVVSEWEFSSCTSLLNLISLLLAWWFPCRRLNGKDGQFSLLVIATLAKMLLSTRRLMAESGSVWMGGLYQ